jgi:DNA excision repair protein ERCC-4
MSVHYKHPVLLIEFEEDKAFSLEVISEMKSYVKPTQKYPKKPANRPATFGASANDPTNDPASSSGPTIQAKLVLLTLSFPRLRIIWSSSPYATAEIFTDLKMNQPEPDPVKAIVIGADGDPDVGKGVNAVAEELLRSLPGIGSGVGAGGSVAGAIMRRCKSVKELCELKEEEVRELVGVGPGKVVYEFLHKGSRD